MKNKMKLFFPATLAVVLLALPQSRGATPSATVAAAADTNSAPTDTMAALFGDPAIVKGKGFEIKRSELDEVVNSVKARAAAAGQTISPEQLMQFEATILDKLIGTQILSQKATDAEKAKGKTEADKQVAKLLEHFGSQAALEEQLKASDMSLDELRAKVTQEATAMATLQDALNITVPDSEVEQFYTNHPADFEQPEQAHVRHILLMTIDPATRAPLPDDQIQSKKKQIDGILKRARAGEDFAKLATQYSEDPGSKDNGGELPPFGRGEMVPQFEAAAFTLNTNQISDVVTTSYGYHIILLLDKIPAKKLALTDKGALARQKHHDRRRQNQGFPDTAKNREAGPALPGEFEKQAGVKILDPDLKAAMEAAAAAATNAPPNAMPEN